MNPSRPDQAPAKAPAKAPATTPAKAPTPAPAKAPAKAPTGNVLGEPVHRPPVATGESTAWATTLQVAGGLVFLICSISSCTAEGEGIRRDLNLRTALVVIVGLLLGATLLIVGTIVKQGILTRRKMK